jgi:hypothetical protein
MPCRLSDLGAENGAQHVRLRRRFGYPGRIDAHERVWLAVVNIAGHAELRLNEAALKHIDQASFAIEITGLLKDRNVLEVELALPDHDGKLWEEVALEIRCSAFLRDVTARWDSGKLLVSGEVAGTCERPLDLYLQIDGVNAGYQAIEAGKSFEFVTAQPANRAAIRVELVDAAAVWHTVEVT